MKVLVNMTQDKKDLVRGGNAVNSCADIKNKAFKLVGLIVYEKEEFNQDTGEVVVNKVSCLKSADGEFYASNSPTICDSVQLLAESYTKEEILDGVDVMIKGKKSGKGREFLYLDLL